MWRCSALALLLVLAGCERYPAGGELRLHEDMVNQPSFRPQRDPLPLAVGAVPMTGVEPPMTREAAIRDLVNPVPVTLTSTERGKTLFRIYCQPCHGPGARGDGPVAAKIATPANLTEQKYVEARDGLFYYTIRYGTPIMPALAEALEPNERWEIVNYVRTLQRR
jgi:mono/diheme cytochrome c family protein